MRTCANVCERVRTCANVCQRVPTCATLTAPLRFPSRQVGVGSQHPQVPGHDDWRRPGNSGHAARRWRHRARGRPQLCGRVTLQPPTQVLCTSLSHRGALQSHRCAYIQRKGGRKTAWLAAASRGCLPAVGHACVANHRSASSAIRLVRRQLQRRQGERCQRR